MKTPLISALFCCTASSLFAGGSIKQVAVHIPNETAPAGGVVQMAGKNIGSHPSSLNGFAGAIVLYNNLSSLPATTFQCPTEDEAKAKLALELDVAIREKAPAGWKGDDTREKQVGNALFPIMSKDREATQAILDIIREQPGY